MLLLLRRLSAPAATAAATGAAPAAAQPACRLPPPLPPRYDFLAEQPELAAAAEAHGLRRRGAPVKHANSHDAELAKKKGGGGALSCWVWVWLREVPRAGLAVKCWLGCCTRDACTCAPHACLFVFTPAPRLRPDGCWLLLLLPCLSCRYRFL